MASYRMRGCLLFVGALATLTSGNALAQSVEATASVGGVSGAADAEVPPPVVTTAAQAAAPAASAEPAAQDSAPASAGAAAAESPVERPWALLHRAYNTFDGSTGGFTLDDPGMGMPGSLRMQLAMGFYSGSDFFYDGDTVDMNEQKLSVSWTALEHLELFASLQNRGVTADLPATSSLQSLGNIQVGAKLGWQLGSLVRLGGSLRVAKQNDVGPDDSSLDSTSFGLRASLALDFQRQTDPLPLILRFNLDYLFDNSARLVDDVEDARYDSLPFPAAKSREVAHLISRVERYGLGINRVDVFTPALGAEMPLELSTDFYLHPIVEWRMGLPVNRAGYNCAYFSGEDDRGSNELAADDTCLDDASFSALPMNLTLGARIVPPWRGVSFAVGADFGLSGTSTFVRELAPNTPFKLFFTVGYDYDARPPAPVVVPEPPAPPPPPPAGRVLGTVVDPTTNAPIGDVVVSLPGAEHTPLATNIAGRFVTYELPPGAVSLELRHPDYMPGVCLAQIQPAGGDVQASCVLTPLPTTGSLTLTARDAYGAPLAGVQVSLVGPAMPSGYSNADGEVRLSELPAGEYSARVQPDANLARVVRFKVQPRQESLVEIALAPKPAAPTVTVQGGVVRARTLRFESGSTQLAAGGTAALAELADLLLRRPELGRLRVQADGGEGLALSRALIIKQGLLDLGVPEARVEAIAEAAGRLTLTLQP